MPPTPLSNHCRSCQIATQSPLVAGRHGRGPCHPWSTIQRVKGAQWHPVDVKVSGTAVVCPQANRWRQARRFQTPSRAAAARGGQTAGGFVVVHFENQWSGLRVPRASPVPNSRQIEGTRAEPVAHGIQSEPLPSSVAVRAGVGARFDSKRKVRTLANVRERQRRGLVHFSTRDVARGLSRFSACDVVSTSPRRPKTRDCPLPRPLRI